MRRSCFALLVLAPWSRTGILVAATEHHVITRMRVDEDDGSVPLRQNINDLEAAGGPQWDLYIQALSAMHNQDMYDPLSYFQIAGIHGKPFIEWDHSGQSQFDDWGGYCPHNEKLFLSWHRPFVRLYEQTLVDHAYRIALAYPSRYRYQYTRAAETLRVPFWDWGVDLKVPKATVPEKLTVYVPDGSSLTASDVENPLRVYKFPRAAVEGKLGTFDPDNRTQTYRCNGPDQSYPDSANANLASRPYKQWLYDAFTRAENFSNFASTADSGVSLEQIHNGIHWDAACGGQFLSADFSAFDPLFMLHHCNVDRLWAYWEAIRPDDAIFLKSYKGGSRFATPSGTDITPDSPLIPFRKNDGEFHTTRTVANIKDFGYAYDGLEYWSKGRDEMKADATELINRLYGDGESQEPGRLGAQGATTRYFAHIHADVKHLRRPCSIDVYVHGSKAGSLVVMPQPRTGMVHGEIPLDDAVGAAGIEKSDADDAVDSIQWSITVMVSWPDGKSAPLDGISGVKIDIEDVETMSPPTLQEFPKFSRSRSRPAWVTEHG